MRPLFFIVLAIIGFMVGHTISEIIFFGILLLAGFVFLVEFIPILRWIVYRTSATLDVIFWGFSAAAIVMFGVTIAGALGVMSLAFTLCYRPYIQNYMSKRKKSR